MAFGLETGDTYSLIVKANTVGVGSFKPIMEPEPIEIDDTPPNSDYRIAAAAYWQAMKDTDNDTRYACDITAQALEERHIDDIDQDELNAALYYESPYRK